MEERIASRIYIAAMQTTSNESGSCSGLKMSFSHPPPWGFTEFICFSLYLVGSSSSVLGNGTSNCFPSFLHFFIFLISFIFLCPFSLPSATFLSLSYPPTSKPTKVLYSRGPFTQCDPPPLKAVVPVYYPETESKTILLFSGVIKML